MNLHKDKEVFEQYLAATMDFMGAVDISIIEKDYFVTYFLKKIAERQPDVVFKGGTSLSKCYKLIKRFSEDLDINVNRETAKLSEGQRRKLSQDIIFIIEESGFSLENPDQIHSRRDFNRYMIDYGMSASESFLKSYLVVETFVPIKSFPTIMMSAMSLVSEFLVANNAEDEVAKYGLEPFKVNVQSIERTFIDKVYAISDYYLDKKTENHSRHIYDLYKLYPEISFDSAFSELVLEVRCIRKPHAACLSAQDGVDLPGLLHKIAHENYFFSDYNQITKTLLFEDVSYSEAISVLDSILEGGHFAY